MPRPTYRYYATIQDPDRQRFGFLLGPYRTLKDATANVPRARDLAVQHSPWADFARFGTLRTTDRRETVFGR